jgi:Asp-tRNA(Asn)/Glu-tRNA(Gln) amidotransferase A subunit family amidase
MPQNLVDVNLLKAIAALCHYPYPERAELWAERLAFNARDLAALRAAPEVAEPPLVLPRPPAAAKPWRPRRAKGRAEIPTDLTSASAGAIAMAVRARKLSPVAVAEHFLARIDAARQLNAFITVRPEQVLADARKLQRRIIRGDDVGPLAGVPVAVKDLMEVRGYPLTGGSKSAEPIVAKHDAPAVARLRAAGALIVGTANLHELAYGATSANPHFGAVVNPNYPGRIPGGSSGGSAAAVAAGLATFAVGTDTGGSIRIPAACCGLVGLKGTYDAVPRDGCLPLSWSLDHIGPITRTVADAALAFEVMAERSLGTSIDGTVPLKKLRIGKPTRLFYELLDHDVRARVEQTIAHLAGDGAKAAEVDIPELTLAPAIWIAICGPEAADADWQRLTQHPEGLGADVRVRIEVGQFFLGTDYVKAQRFRHRLRNALLSALDRFDVLITPTMPMPALAIGTTTVKFDRGELPSPVALTRCTAPFNLAGLPAVSVPCGRDRHGVTIGLQIAGRPGDEAGVLRVAARLEHLMQAAL